MGRRRREKKSLSKIIRVVNGITLFLTDAVSELVTTKYEHFG